MENCSRNVHMNVRLTAAISVNEFDLKTKPRMF